ncbi:MAG: prepilin-type N-terminal cleavage/methylation domain-containing protein [Synergistaceae bacterium]|nr:prepilin-type N-terminal cleavage/methylation domain-containing protein [Synergistaceae bacterium]
MGRYARSGFTLTELLIVVLLIGILSSMMMLSSSESVSTTKAGNIVNNLRNLASAAMMYYVDSADYFIRNFDGPPQKGSKPKGDLKPYVFRHLRNEWAVQDSSDYYVRNNSGTWWAGYKIPTTADADSVKKKLKGRAITSGLKGSASESTYPAPNSTASYNGEAVVWLMIRTNTH